MSEVCDDLLMWAHYGESHQGIVIKFKCLPEADNALCIAQPVSYSETIPYLTTIQDCVNGFCGIESFNVKEYFRKRALTKSPHWCYEKEWRVIDFDPQMGQDRFTDHLIHPEEIERSLYQVKEIEQAIVVPVVNTEFGFRPVAFIKLQGNVPIKENKLIRALLRRSCWRE